MPGNMSVHVYIICNSQFISRIMYVLFSIQVAFYFYITKKFKAVISDGNKRSPKIVVHVSIENIFLSSLATKMENEI